MTDPRIRKATRADVPAMVDAMAHAFYDDPVFNWLFPNDDRRLAQSRTYFAGRTRSLIRQDEVRRADAAGASPTARKALGFEELLRGDEEAMKHRTRNYAKRQLTWMRRLEGVSRVDAEVGLSRTLEEDS